MEFQNTVQVCNFALNYIRRDNADVDLTPLLLTTIKKRRKSRRKCWSYPKSNHYFSEIWQNYDDDRFFKKYRLSKETFTYISSELTVSIGKIDTHLRRCVPMQKRVAVALHFLKSSCDADTIADLYGIGRSTAAEILVDFCEAINKTLGRQYVKFPVGEELDRLESEFSRRWGFPGCIGLLDGCHISILAPKTEPADYFNYKKYFSVVLMAVVDAQYKFTMTNIGQTGRNADSTVFSRTKLCQRFETGQVLRSNQDYHLISDAAFPLHEWLMKPFIQNSNIPAYQKHFNYRLSRARMTVENAFGRLKGRWRILLNRLDHNVENCVKTIRACVIVHNICESHTHEYFEEWDDEPHSPEDMYVQPDTPSHNSNSRLGDQKRHAIATSLREL